ncbi:hypothetical protein B0G84_1803 [Paraburkholderia sp. BL8N3]|nr:hypothetical protein [Paraburkholderia sp. BL8N3]TCK43467.1 hypothetical protein B0G84_1803 [Paraburkholderia sp. BL8N3]
MLDNLKTLHDAIVGGLRDAIAGMDFIDAYPKLGRKIPTPCIVIELSEIEPGHDPGTGQTSLIGRFQARAIVDPLADGAELGVRELAARIAQAIHAQTWELPVTPAKLVQIAEDPFRPHLDTYLVWLVEWTHEFDLGDMMPPVPPGGSAVLWGVEPAIGGEHASAYWDPERDPAGDPLQDPLQDIGASGGEST